MKLKSAAYRPQYGGTSTVTDGQMMGTDWKLGDQLGAGSNTHTSQKRLPLQSFNLGNENTSTENLSFDAQIVLSKLIVCLDL